MFYCTLRDAFMEVSFLFNHAPNVVWYSFRLIWKTDVLQNVLQNCLLLWWIKNAVGRTSKYILSICMYIIKYKFWWDKLIVPIMAVKQWFLFMLVGINHHWDDQIGPLFIHVMRVWFIAHSQCWQLIWYRGWHSDIIMITLSQGENKIITLCNIYDHTWTVRSCSLWSCS